MPPCFDGRHFLADEDGGFYTTYLLVSLWVVVAAIVAVDLLLGWGLIEALVVHAPAVVRDATLLWLLLPVAATLFLIWRGTQE